MTNKGIDKVQLQAEIINVNDGLQFYYKPKRKKLHKNAQSREY